MKKYKNKEGFTLIELLVVIGIIAILAGVVIVALNPARQFAQARNSQRESNVNAILNAIGQNMADNKGVWTCSSYPSIASSSVAEVISDGAADIAPCLVPTYISIMPVDPSTGSYTDTTTYDTGYTILQSSSTSRITISAPETELTTSTISATR